MAGSRHDLDAQRTRLELVAVGHRVPVELHPIGARDDIGRVVPLRQLESPGHVVVVDVRLEHHHAPHSELVEHGLDPVEITLRVDHDSGLPVVSDITAVSEVARLDHFYVELAHVVVILRRVDLIAPYK